MDNNHDIVAPGELDPLDSTDKTEGVNEKESDYSPVFSFKEALESVIGKAAADKTEFHGDEVKESLSQEFADDPELCEAISANSDDFADAFIDTFKDMFTGVAFEAHEDFLSGPNDHTDLSAVSVDIGKGVLGAIADTFSPELACEIAEAVEVKMETIGLPVEISEALSDTLEGALSAVPVGVDVENRALDLGDGTIIDDYGAADATTGDSIPYDFANDDAVSAFVSEVNVEMSTFLADVDYDPDRVESVGVDTESADTDAVDGGVEADSGIERLDTGLDDTDEPLIPVSVDSTEDASAIDVGDTVEPEDASSFVEVPNASYEDSAPDSLDFDSPEVAIGAYDYFANAFEAEPVSDIDVGESD